MNNFICVSRLQTENSKYSYFIRDPKTGNNFILTADAAKALIKGGTQIIGLTVTSNNRLLYNSDKVISTAKSVEITVAELVEGHILAQNIAFITGKKTKGLIPETSIDKRVITEAGYILNTEMINKIKRHYGKKCTVRVMTAIETRSRLISDTNFRRRLAIFFAHQMRNANYMHVERIASKGAKKAYDYLLNNLLKSEYLEQDVNLLMLLFTLYGYHMYTFEHSIDVAIYACLLYAHIAYKQSMTLDLKLLEDFFICGLFHDIGKLNVSIELLDKQGKLTDEEKAQMQSHPIISRQILDNACKYDSAIFVKYKQDQLRKDRLLLGAYLHHQDSTKEGTRGYPLEALVKQCDLAMHYATFCRIISIADCFDGMISPRPYRATMHENIKNTNKTAFINCKTTLKYLREDARQGKLDSTLVEYMADMILQDKDFDDLYDKKITNAFLGLNDITNFPDLTKSPNYKPLF